MAILRTQDIRTQAETKLRQAETKLKQAGENIKNKLADVKIKNKKTNRLESIVDTQGKKNIASDAKQKLSNATNKIKNKVANISVNKNKANLKAQETKIIDNPAISTSEKLSQVFGTPSGLGVVESPAMWQKSQLYNPSEFVGKGNHLDVKSSPSLKRRFSDAKESMAYAASRINKFGGSLENLASESLNGAKGKLSSVKRQLSESIETIGEKANAYKENIVDKFSKAENVQDVRFWEQNAAYKDGGFVGPESNKEGAKNVSHRETFTREPAEKASKWELLGQRMSKSFSEIDLSSVKAWFKDRMSRSDSNIEKAGKEEQRSNPARSVNPEASSVLEDSPAQKQSHAQRISEQRAAQKISGLSL